jgi:ribosomal protein S18 acetylase RimI-like enzyme
MANMSTSKPIREIQLVEAPPSFDRTLALDLMRLADDSETEILGYMPTGRLFLLYFGDLSQLPIGQLLLWEHGEGVVEIKSLSISPAIQHIGMGTYFVEGVIALLKRNGTKRIHVSTSTADHDVIRFYQKNGFRFQRVERDAFTIEKGYPASLICGDIPIRDRIWMDLEL